MNKRIKKIRTKSLLVGLTFGAVTGASVTSAIALSKTNTAIATMTKQAQERNADEGYLTGNFLINEDFSMSVPTDKVSHFANESHRTTVACTTAKYIIMPDAENGLVAVNKSDGKVAQVLQLHYNRGPLKDQCASVAKIIAKSLVYLETVRDDLSSERGSQSIIGYLSSTDILQSNLPNDAKKFFFPNAGCTTSPYAILRMKFDDNLGQFSIADNPTNSLNCGIWYVPSYAGTDAATAGSGYTAPISSPSMFYDEYYSFTYSVNNNIGGYETDGNRGMTIFTHSKPNETYQVSLQDYDNAPEQDAPGDEPPSYGDPVKPLRPNMSTRASDSNIASASMVTIGNDVYLATLELTRKDRMTTPYNSDWEDPENMGPITPTEDEYPGYEIVDHAPDEWKKGVISLRKATGINSGNAGDTLNFEYLQNGYNSDSYLQNGAYVNNKYPSYMKGDLGNTVVSNAISGGYLALDPSNNNHLIWRTVLVRPSDSGQDQEFIDITFNLSDGSIVQDKSFKIYTTEETIPSGQSNAFQMDIAGGKIVGNRLYISASKAKNTATGDLAHNIPLVIDISLPNAGDLLKNPFQKSTHDFFVPDFISTGDPRNTSSSTINSSTNPFVVVPVVSDDGVRYQDSLMLIENKGNPSTPTETKMFAVNCAAKDYQATWGYLTRLVGDITNELVVNESNIDAATVDKARLDEIMANSSVLVNSLTQYSVNSTFDATIKTKADGLTDEEVTLNNYAGRIPLKQLWVDHAFWKDSQNRVSAPIGKELNLTVTGFKKCTTEANTSDDSIGPGAINIGWTTYLKQLGPGMPPDLTKQTILKALKKGEMNAFRSLFKYLPEDFRAEDLVSATSYTDGLGLNTVGHLTLTIKNYVKDGKVHKDDGTTLEVRDIKVWGIRTDYYTVISKIPETAELEVTVDGNKAICDEGVMDIVKQKIKEYIQQEVDADKWGQIPSTFHVIDDKFEFVDLYTPTTTWAKGSGTVKVYVTEYYDGGREICMTPKPITFTIRGLGNYNTSYSKQPGDFTYTGEKEISAKTITAQEATDAVAQAIQTHPSQGNFITGPLVNSGLDRSKITSEQLSISLYLGVNDGGLATPTSRWINFGINPNFGWTNGELGCNIRNLYTHVDGLSDRETHLATDGGNYNYDQIFTEPSVPPKVDNTTALTDQQVKDAIQAKASTIFSGLTKGEDPKFTFGDNAINRTDTKRGIMSVTFTLNNSYPFPNQQYTIHINGFAAADTHIKDGKDVIDLASTKWSKYSNSQFHLNWEGVDPSSTTINPDKTDNNALAELKSRVKDVVEDLPPEFNFDNDVRVQSWNTDTVGEASVTFTFSRIYDKTSNGHTKNFTFKFTGFKKEGLTTTIDNTNQISVNAEGKKKTADEIASNPGLLNSVDYGIKEQIVSKISNLAGPFNNPVKKEDIEFASSDITHDSNAGTVTVKVRLNNCKGWSNGVIQQSLTLDNAITLNGFKILQKTEFTSKNIIEAPKLATISYAGNATAATITGSAAATNMTASTQDELNGAVQKYLSTIDLNPYINNLPQSYADNPSEFVMNYVSITESEANNSTGEISFKLGLRKYNDVTEGSSSSDVTLQTDLGATKKTNLMKLTGFYKNPVALTTKISSPTEAIALDTVSGILPETWVNGDHASVIDTMKQKAAAKVINLAYDNKSITNGELSSLAASDIELTDFKFNNVEGKVTATVKVINNFSKCWTDGVVHTTAFAFSETISFSGFKKLSATGVIESQKTQTQDRFKTMFASKECLPLSELSSIIEANKSKWFQGIEGNVRMSLDETQTVYNMDEGKIIAKIKFEGYYNAEGVYNSGTIFDEITFTGFISNIQAFTTTLDASPIELSGASTTVATNWYGFAPNIRNLLLNERIKYPAFNRPININDVDVTPTPTDDVPTGIDVVNGKVYLKVTLNGSKYWNNKEVKDTYTFPDVIAVSGFRPITPLQPIHSGVITITDDQFKGSFASPELWSKDQLLDYVKANPNKVFKEGTLGVTEQMSIPEEPEYNLDGGYISFNLSVSNYINDLGEYDTTHPMVITIKIIDLNDKATSPNLFTTTFDGQTLKLPLADALPSEFDKIKDDRITPQIINKIHNPALGKKIEIGDISYETSSIVHNNSDGTLRVTAKLNGNKWWDNGTIDPSHSLGEITISGFRTQKQTGLKNPSAEWTEDSFKTKYAKEQQVSSEEIKRFVESKKDEMFENLDKTSTLSIKDDIQYKPAEGKIVANVLVTNYYDSNGDLQVGKTSDPLPVTLYGFKTEGLTTTLDNTTEIYHDFSTIVPSKWDSVQDELKKLVAPKIHSAAFGVEVLPTDITIIPNSVTPDNTNGKLKFKVSLGSSKYWNQGEIQANHEFTDQEITVTGFKSQATTTIATETSIPMDMSDKYTNTFDEAQLKAYIMANKQKFATNLPESNNFDELFEISHFDNTKITSSEVTFDLTVKHFFNADGDEINNEAAPGAPTAKFTLTGFKNSGFTTELDNSQVINLQGVDTILGKDMESAANKETVQRAIFTAVQSKIQFLANGKQTSALQYTDLDFAYQPNTADNTNGQAQVKLTLKNGNAWVDAQIQDNYTFGDKVYTLAGFATKQQTTPNQTKLTVEGDWTGKFANEFKGQPALDFLNANIKKLFNNLPDDAKIVIANDSQIVPSIEEGFVTITLKLSSYINDAGNVTSEGCPDYTIKVDGFKHTGYTTTFTPPGEYKLSGVETMTADKYTTQVDVIKEKALEFIKNTNTNESAPTKSDIELLDPTVDLVNGKVTLSVQLTHNKYWELTVPKQTHKFDTKLVITGFQQVKPTKAIQDAVNRTDKSFASMVNTSFTQDQAEKILWEQKDTLFTNLPTDGITKFSDLFTIEGFTASEPNLGKVSLTLKTTKYFNDQGELSTDAAHAPKVDVTFSGFLSSNLTTTLIDSDIKASELGLTGLATEFNLDNAELTNKLKTILISRIVKPASTVEAQDIDVAIAQAPNNRTGSLKIKVTLKNDKYSNDQGKPVSSHEFPELITINGFKTQNPTTFNEGSKNLPAPASFSKKPTTAFTEEDAKKLVYDYRDTLYSNLPTQDVNGFDDIFERLSFNNTEPTSGKVTMTIKLKKYYDANGVFQNMPSNEVNEIIISGFDSANGTTKFENGYVHGNEVDMSSFVAQTFTKDWKTKESVIKDQLAKHIVGTVYDPTNGKLTASDIELTEMEVDQDYDKVQVQVHVIGGKGQVNFESRPDLDITNGKGIWLTGFKHDQNVVSKEPTKDVCTLNAKDLKANYFESFESFYEYIENFVYNRNGLDLYNKLAKPLVLPVNIPDIDDQGPDYMDGRVVKINKFAADGETPTANDITYSRNDDFVDVSNIKIWVSKWWDPNTTPSTSRASASDATILKQVRGTGDKGMYTDADIDKCKVITLNITGLKIATKGESNNSVTAGLDNTTLIAVISSVSIAALLLILLLIVLIVKKKRNDQYIKDDEFDE